MTGLPALAAVAIAILVIIGILKIIKETVWMGLAIVVVLSVLYFGFGITPQIIWLAAQNLIQQATGAINR